MKYWENHNRHQSSKFATRSIERGTVRETLEYIKRDTCLTGIIPQEG